MLSRHPPFEVDANLAMALIASTAAPSTPLSRAHVAMSSLLGPRHSWLAHRSSTNWNARADVFGPARPGTSRWRRGRSSRRPCRRGRSAVGRSPRAGRGPGNWPAAGRSRAVDRRSACTAVRCSKLQLHRRPRSPTMMPKPSSVTAVAGPRGSRLCHTADLAGAAADQDDGRRGTRGRVPHAGTGTFHPPVSRIPCTQPADRRRRPLGRCALRLSPRSFLPNVNGVSNSGAAGAGTSAPHRPRSHRHRPRTARAARGPPRIHDGIRVHRVPSVDVPR